ncbi:DUF2796 domain-containing protein [Roseobacter sp.]|uniref:zinc uptake protein ZrgA n=1 Tax=Roseobacter sp. TaxID=1907202 RepID=UPI00385BD644
MKTLPLLALSTIIAGPLLAETTRQLDAHEHGVSQLDIAFDGQKIAMELHAPGADIVGFEYAAESATDRAAVDEAVAKLARPLDLFELPEAAGCSVVQASASLESEEEHDDHDAHAEHHDHEDEKHEEHAEHAEYEEHEDRAEHEEDSGHTEFHAEYLLTCADTAAATEITFAFFDSFPNAQEVEVQVLTETGATAFDVERDAPSLNIRGMF